MKQKFLLPFLALFIIGLVSTAPQAHAAKGGGGSELAVPITGTFTDALGGTGTFAGTATIESFKVVGDQLVAVGTLSGKLTDSLGHLIGTVRDIIVNLTVTGAVGSCEILRLDLGPLDLDLLGLQVHLSDVLLTITAQSGAGNLLGNLLCAIASLLDAGGLLTDLVDLLNALVGLFGSV
jgi:hypothetical protein